VALILFSGACSSGPEITSEQRGRIPEDAVYLIAPAQGYSQALSPTVATALRAAHSGLVQRSATDEARQVSADLLGRNPALDPARVLSAQAALVDGDLDSVVSSLQPVIERHPHYDAANLAFARAAELSGLFPEALFAYGSMAERSQLATARFEAIRAQAVEVLANRVAEALARRRIDAARSNLALLERWAPGATETLQAAVAVAVFQDDKLAELQALRELSAIVSMDQERVLRRARLELEVGDAGTGLRIVQDLNAKRPEDSRLAAELARAKFLWRLELLPEKVQELSRQPELRRGDLAAMLYWLFPSVRYGRADAGRIANDVLNHPHRQEIVRVANLGIMSIDARLHEFQPDRVLSRAAAMVPILRILGRQRPLPACLSGHNVANTMSSSQVCELAFRCGLLDETVDCLPSAGSSGAAAIEWTRRALDNLGIE
jgi:hypothetical protein